MGIADAIVDLVSSGTTLRENNLKEIDGGIILESQVICFLMKMFSHQSCHTSFLKMFILSLWHGLINAAIHFYQAVLVASKKSLKKREGVLDTVHEILERLEAHLRADGQFTVCRMYLILMTAVLFTLWSHFFLSWKVVANMRGSSAEDVAKRVLSQASLSGLQVKLFLPFLSQRIFVNTSKRRAIGETLLSFWLAVWHTPHSR